MLAVVRKPPLFYALASFILVLDEAGQRISRYLLMQSLINGGLGVAVGLGLFLKSLGRPASAAGVGAE
jgi:predicted PurR-regulated permease PerM